MKNETLFLEIDRFAHKIELQQNQTKIVKSPGSPNFGWKWNDTAEKKW